MSLLDRSRIETLAAVAGDDSRAAHSMPGWYYNDPAMFEQEKSSLFADGWVCAGHASEIASPGQYMAVKIGDEPVVVVRDRRAMFAPIRMSAGIAEWRLSRARARRPC